MALYLMGDLQGCNTAFQQLLHELNFSHDQDQLYILGDLVNRGPGSLEILRYVKQHEAHIHCVLGNHDLHLLAVAHGSRRPSADDTLDPILQAPDCEQLLNWLRCQPLAMALPLDANGPIKQALLVHAGVLPSWTTAQTLAYAKEVSDELRGPGYLDFLIGMYGKKPTRWSPDLTGMARLRLITNVLTRIRFCDADDRIELASKGGLAATPSGYQAWFDIEGRKTAKDLVAFGHWSTLGLLQRPNLLALDTGCVWGGCLSAVELSPQGQVKRLVQVNCEQALAPT
jgi:bis(5'-nucleosyl)-tetraphosphatase (symmetrical)